MSSNKPLPFDKYQGIQEGIREEHTIKDPKQPSDSQKPSTEKPKVPNKPKPSSDKNVPKTNINNPQKQIVDNGNKNGGINNNNNNNSNGNKNEIITNNNSNTNGNSNSNGDVVYHKQKIIYSETIPRSRTTDNNVSNNVNSSTNSNATLLPDNDSNDTKDESPYKNGIPLTTLLPIIIVGLVCAAFFIARRKRKNSQSAGSRYGNYDGETDISTLNNDSASDLLSTFPSAKETLAETENTYVNNQKNSMNRAINTMGQTNDYYGYANPPENIPSVIIPNVSISNPGGKLSNVNLINGKIPSIIHPNVPVTNGNVCNVNMPNVALSNGVNGTLQNGMLTQGYGVVNCNNDISNGMPVVSQYNNLISTNQNLINNAYIVYPNTPPFNTKKNYDGSSDWQRQCIHEYQPKSIEPHQRN